MRPLFLLLSERNLAGSKISTSFWTETITMSVSVSRQASTNRLTPLQTVLPRWRVVTFHSTITVSRWGGGDNTTQEQKATNEYEIRIVLRFVVVVVVVEEK